MKKTNKITLNGIGAIWVCIIFCFLLIAGPLILIFDASNIRISGIPIIYIFVFSVWIVLCILTFIGYKMHWGDKDDQ